MCICCVCAELVLCSCHRERIPQPSRKEGEGKWFDIKLGGVFLNTITNVLELI